MAFDGPRGVCFQADERCVVLEVGIVEEFQLECQKGVVRVQFVGK